MPYIDFECGDCGNEFEFLNRLTEAESPPACPKCLGKQTHKKVVRYATLETMPLSITDREAARKYY